MLASGTHLTMPELEAGLEFIRQSPKDDGILELIVARPARGSRQSLEAGTLSLDEGLVGDSWRIRGSSKTADGSAFVEMQLTLMNARVAALLAREKSRWNLAGDQLFVDLDLSDENLPAGSLLSIGCAIIQITSEPHTGCKKFTERYGSDAVKFVNSRLGKRLHLRGVNAKVIHQGEIRIGDRIRKVSSLAARA